MPCTSSSDCAHSAACVYSADCRVVCRPLPRTLQQDAEAEREDNEGGDQFDQGEAAAFMKRRCRAPRDDHSRLHCNTGVARRATITPPRPRQQERARGEDPPACGRGQGVTGIGPQGALDQRLHRRNSSRVTAPVSQSTLMRHSSAVHQHRNVAAGRSAVGKEADAPGGFAGLLLSAVYKFMCMFFGNCTGARARRLIAVAAQDPDRMSFPCLSRSPDRACSAARRRDRGWPPALSRRAKFCENDSVTTLIAIAISTMTATSSIRLKPRLSGSGPR